MVYIIGGYYQKSSGTPPLPMLYATDSVLAISIRDLYSARDLYACPLCNDAIPSWQDATALRWPFGGFSTATMRYATPSKAYFAFIALTFLPQLIFARQQRQHTATTDAIKASACTGYLRYCFLFTSKSSLVPDKCICAKLLTTFCRKA